MNLIIDLINGTLPTLQNQNVLHCVIYWFSNVLTLVFLFMYLHQWFYLILGTVYNKKPKKNKEHKKHSVGIVISARNEEAVIGNLIDSIQKNDYPKDLCKIFVIADNCTDSTAEICRNKGCYVFERNDPEHIGKGYALNYLFTKLHTEDKYKDLAPEAYIVLDADNVVKPNFITEINKVYDEGYEIVTSYRNSKNFSKNWISSGYGLWFLHEARHLNNSRMILHTSCSISGTGFLISKKVIEEYDNWKFFTMTEDIECATDFATTGRKAGYCSTAEFYDEQPTTFKQSYVQRERWAKGYYQVLFKYSGKLIKGFFTNFSCWDMFTTLFPALFLTIACFVFYPVIAIIASTARDGANVLYALEQLGSTFLMFYPIIFVIGLLATITEWKKIICSPVKKILYMFTFPLFMYTYIPVSLGAIIRYKKIVWKPILHKENLTIEDMENEQETVKTAGNKPMKVLADKTDASQNPEKDNVKQ